MNTAKTRDFESFASAFTDDCEVHLRSMREHKTPARSRREIIDHLHDILKDQCLTQYHIVSLAVDEDNMRIYCEMANSYNIHGKSLPFFAETAIVTFNPDGLVKTFKLYSCRSDLVFLIQKATGSGPYSQEYLDHETVDCC
ncbi:hypothetical protein MY11210_001561 [Beauveria gryllotalpidicola]